VAVALAFALHALSVPPTNGANLFEPTVTAADHAANAPTAGAGETLAVIALAVGFGCLLLAFTAD
jgi:hypothetical protein